MPQPTPSSPRNNPSHATLHNFHANAMMFGATGDGTTDDTTALQSAIDTLTVGGAPTSITRHASAPLFLPKGTYKITAPLVVRSIEGFELAGAGRETIIQASGTFSPIVDANGWAHCRMRDLTIKGTASGTNTDALLVRWTAGTIRSTTMNMFENIFIEGGNWVNGIQVGDTTTQVDENMFTGCRVTGGGSADATYWQNGYRLGNGTAGNVLTQSIVKPNVSACKYGVKFDGSGASIIGGGFQNNDTDFNMGAKTADPISIRSVRCEGSDRLLDRSTGSSGAAQSVSLEDIDWSANGIHADGIFIKARTGGLYRFSNIFVHGAGGTTPKIDLNNAALGPAHAVLTNVSTKTAVASLFNSVSGFSYEMTYFQNDDVDTLSGSAYVRVPITTGDITVSNLTTGGVIGMGGAYIDMNAAGSFIQMLENGTTDAAAGVANTGRLYVKDNGAGKTQLCVRFNTGAVQVIATEP